MVTLYVCQYLRRLCVCVYFCAHACMCAYSYVRAHICLQASKIIGPARVGVTDPSQLPHLGSEAWFSTGTMSFLKHWAICLASRIILEYLFGGIYYQWMFYLCTCFIHLGLNKISPGKRSRVESTSESLTVERMLDVSISALQSHSEVAVQMLSYSPRIS